MKVYGMLQLFQGIFAAAAPVSTPAPADKIAYFGTLITTLVAAFSAVLAAAALYTVRMSRHSMKSIELTLRKLAEHEQREATPELQSVTSAAAPAAGAFSASDPRPGSTPIGEITPDTITLFRVPMPQDRQAQLARFWVTVAAFERTYRLIFGQQLRLLEAANSQPINIEDARKFFAASKKLGNTQTFENFVAFLVTASLLQQNAATLQITAFGRQFLIYIASEGYPLDKGL